MAQLVAARVLDVGQASICPLISERHIASTAALPSSSEPWTLRRPNAEFVTVMEGSMSAVLAEERANAPGSDMRTASWTLVKRFSSRRGNPTV